jgi:hypothetical protein
MTVLEPAEDLGMLQPADVQWLISEHLGVDFDPDTGEGDYEGVFDW